MKCEFCFLFLDESQNETYGWLRWWPTKPLLTLSLSLPLPSSSCALSSNGQILFLKRMSFFVWLLFEESDRAVNCDLCMHALEERRGEHNEESCAWKLQSLNHPLILLISSIYCTKQRWNEDDMLVFHSKWCLKLRRQLLKTLLLLTSKLVTKFAPTCSSFYVLSKNTAIICFLEFWKGKACPKTFDISGVLFSSIDP